LTERIVELPLKAGDNLLAAKVLSGKGGWNLSLASPTELPAMVDPRKASNCVELSMESGGKLLARERLALRPVTRVAAASDVKWDEPLDRWQTCASDFVLGGANVTNLFEKQPDRSKWWQGENDLSATGWLRCDSRRLYLLLWVLDDKDVTGNEPEKIRWFDCLRVIISRDGKAVDEYSIGRLGAKPAVYKEQSAGGLPKGLIDAKANEIQVDVTRHGKGTLYRLSLDRAMLGEGAFGLNFLVNDNDEGYRKQYLQYTEGFDSPASWKQFILP
jgi:hypothetical protein